MGNRQSDKNNRVIATNRKARHRYAIEETLEAGLVLVGSEVKSLREGHVTFGDGYVDVRKGELWLANIHIHEYVFANRLNHEPARGRKLLLKRNEIKRVIKRLEEKGYTGVPLQLYFKGGRVKVEIGLGRGKRMADKRQDVKARDAQRDIDRAMKH
ncbi:MAG: SsrA-binding protein SmpB [Myxococcota bacterium]